MFTFCITNSIICIVVILLLLIRHSSFYPLLKIKCYDVVNISNTILYVTRKEFVPDSVLVENKS